MFQQLSLFPVETKYEREVIDFRRNIQEAGFKHQEVEIGDITFKAGQNESVHRWYRLTPSYSPNLVRFLIQEFKIEKEHLVFDPFSGRGTTSIECQKCGIESISIEINPVLQNTSITGKIR